MNANTIVSVRDHVLLRIGERESVTVIGGEQFVKNVWNSLELPEYNSTVLSETLTELYSDGLVKWYEQKVSKGGEEVAGVVRDRSVTRQRIYSLTDAGEREYKRLLASRNDMPQQT